METTIRKKNIPSDKISKILSKKKHLHKISESLKYQIFQKYEDSNEILEILNDYCYFEESDFEIEKDEKNLEKIKNLQNITKVE